MKKSNNQNITKKDIEQTTQTILKAVDFGFRKTNTRIDKIDNKINNAETNIFGLKESFKETNKKLDKLERKIDEVYNKIDKFLLMYTKQEQENKIILTELKIIKNVLRQKLGVDVDKLIFA